MLLEALKEQRKELDELKIQVADISSYKKSLSNNDIINGIITKSELFQNAPNPFDESTIIQYSVPELQNGTINIYDLQGKQLRSFSINSTGKLSIPASMLNPGMYLYNLIVNGIVIDTKQMILTN